MKVAFHAEVSSERQDIDFPISAPLKALRKYNSHNRHSVIKEYFDEVESRQPIDRPASSRRLSQR